MCGCERMFPCGRRMIVIQSMSGSAAVDRRAHPDIPIEEVIMIKRTASAVWTGGIKDGKGTISTQSGVLDKTQYGFSARFENGAGTNPEELIGAAHAGCFTMALSGELGKAGMTATRLVTTATVSLDKVEGGFSISAVHLDLVATIPGASQEAFEAAALAAKSNCPVSKLLNATITLDARLEQ
jgi:lipoyl-dependent peroxiredoxin